MAMDVGANSNAEPKSEVNAVEGTPNQEGTSENNQALDGVAVKSVGDIQNDKNG